MSKLHSIYQFFPVTQEEPREEASELESNALEQWYTDYESGLSGTHVEARELREDMNAFGEVIERVTERGREMVPFNKYVIRVLKYGDHRIINSIPFIRLFYGAVAGYSCADLVTKYYTFFNNQAEDFGRLFFHVARRERKLERYNAQLMKKGRFYATNKDHLGKINEEKAEERKRVTDREETRQLDLEYRQTKAVTNAVSQLQEETQKNKEEVEGLLEWCAGMKGILAYSKENMENRGQHMKETLPAYMQATYLNKGFRETRKVVEGLVAIIQEAQQSADEGISSVTTFIEHNGLQGKRRREVLEVF